MGSEAVGSGSLNHKVFGHPPAHPLGKIFYSQAPVRYVAYVAKLAVVPTAGTMTAIAEAAPFGDQCV